MVTSTKGQLLWADKAARAPRVRSGVAEMPLSALRAAAVKVLWERAAREAWPLRGAIDDPATMTTLAQNLAKNAPGEVWFHPKDQDLVPALPLSRMAGGWMPRRMVLFVPSLRRVGAEWTTSDGRSSSLAIWSPEQVGVFG